MTRAPGSSVTTETSARLTVAPMILAFLRLWTVRMMRPVIQIRDSAGVQSNQSVRANRNVTQAKAVSAANVSPMMNAIPSIATTGIRVRQMVVTRRPEIALILRSSAQEIGYAIPILEIASRRKSPPMGR